MSTTNPKTTPLSNYKRTKIVATVGPATSSQEAILDMMKAGVNGFRLNFSHGTNEERDEQIPWIRKASKELDKPVAIIQDLQGPKIRLGDFEGFIPIQKNQSLSFQYKCEYKEGGPIPTQYDLSKKVKRGERILLYDGRVKTIVTSVKDGTVYVEAQNDGIVTQRKGINLPDTDFAGDILTTKDKKDIVYGVGQDIDYVALSFVQKASDVEKLKKLLKNYNSSAKVIAKIETRAAVDNLEEIVQASDAVMVARGDLAMETEPESVPIVQRSIIGLCQRYEKISIVATQMLASMAEDPEPTRAEVSDVATSVIVGADAVMLSDETAMGKYPIETIKMMKRIILYTQKNAPLKPDFYREEDESVQGSISSALITLAHQVNAQAIVAETSSGATALNIASHRPNMPMFAVTSNKRVAQQLAIVYGSKSFVRPVSKYAATKLSEFLRQQHIFSKDDIVVISSGKYPGKVGGTDTIKVRRIDS
jgi:pyruvate kinase